MITIGSVARAVFARIALFIVVVCLVWIAYVWLYAYHPDALGWFYARLRPVTVAFYQLVDTRLPDAIKYKVSAGLSDELGPRALFLLILGGMIEVVVLGIYRAVVRLLRGNRPVAPPT
jgi:hypothetical protein